MTALPTLRAFVLGNFVQACCWHVPRLPLPGETLEAQRLHIEPGGKGLNVAVCLHRLGAAVSTLIGCGDDPAGDALLALLAQEGLDTAHIHRLPGASGWGAGLIGADGRNCIAVYPGANRLLTAAHAEAARPAIEAAQLVYGQFETALPAVEAAFAIAHARGIPTVLNPSPWQAPSAALHGATHTVIANEVEAAEMLALPAPLPATPHGAARAVWAGLAGFSAQWPAARRLVITLGEHGALAAERGGDAGWTLWHAPARAIDVVDTLGAGDGFASGFALAAMQGQPLPVALAWGNACGAHVAAQAGVLNALPDAQRLREMLASEALPSASQLTFT